MTKEEFYKVRGMVEDMEYYDNMSMLNNKYAKRFDDMELEPGDEIEIEVSICKRMAGRMPGNSDRKVTVATYSASLKDTRDMLEEMRRKVVNKLNDVNETFSQL